MVKGLKLKVKFKSMVEFISFFGGAPVTQFNIEADDNNYSLEVEAETNYNLYRSMQLFFANGGGASYIVSVGSYAIWKISGLTTKIWC